MYGTSGHPTQHELRTLAQPANPVCVPALNGSLAIRLPAAVVEELKLRAGDAVNIRVASADNFIVEREPTREELIARIRKMGRPLPPGFKFNREEANARR